MALEEIIVKDKSMLRVKEICLLSITSNVTNNKMNLSQPLFVFAALLIPSFNVWTDYFCFTQFGGSFPLSEL